VPRRESEPSGPAACKWRKRLHSGIGVSLIPGVAQLIADKGYDTDAFRRYLKDQGIKPVIPGKSNRKKRIRYDKEAYKGRNVIERCFCRLKDFRRIATRYDKLARNFLSAVCFVAVLAYGI
jgi:transposase